MVVTCEHVWNEVSNYVDGELSPDLRTSIDEHVRGCARCHSVLEGTRNVVRLYGDERMLDLPAGFSHRLERRLAKTIRPQRWVWWTAWLAPAAAVLLIAIGVWHANVIHRDRALKTPHAQPGKNIPPELQVVLTPDTRLFHVAGCSFIHDKTNLEKMTAKEAIARGYTPCPRCLGKYLNTAKLVAPDDDDLDADNRASRGQPTALR